MSSTSGSVIFPSGRTTTLPESSRSFHTVMRQHVLLADNVLIGTWLLLGAVDRPRPTSAALSGGATTGAVNDEFATAETGPPPRVDGLAGFGSSLGWAGASAGCWIVAAAFCSLLAVGISVWLDWFPGWPVAAPVAVPEVQSEAECPGRFAKM